MKHGPWFLAVAVALAAGNLAAAELPRAERFVNSAGMTMVPVAAGEFVMGCGEGPPQSQEAWQQRDGDESPAHRVTLPRRFFLGAHEVTNAQFERFDPKHKELRGKFGVSGGDDEPVTMVSWQHAMDFCRWLSEKEGLPYRLPTEAEWEYACRAATTTAYNTGEQLAPAQANMGLSPDGKEKLGTAPVGSYRPSAWGLYDMHGNVEEWCLDWYGPYAAGAQTDPVGPADGYARVTRGGAYSIPSWQPHSGRYCRSSNRAGYLPEDANRCVGFRVAMGPMPATKPLPAHEPPLHQRDVLRKPAPKSGPDPKQPHFVNFTERRAAPRLPENVWGPIFSHWNHDTALCVCPNGDVLAVWYTTVSESGRELALAASRLRAGSDRWDPASLFFDVPDVNDHAPALLCHEGRVYHFCSQALRSWQDAACIMRVSEDSGATWSKPRIIIPRDRQEANPRHLNQPVCAFATRRGALCLVNDADPDSSLSLSLDRGRSWRVARGLIRGIHAAAFERDDGAIVAFGRGPDPMPMSVSTDLGESWAVKATPFGPVSVGNRAAALKLPGGALLLCASDTRKPPLTGKHATLAALSTDDGKTWSHVRAVPGVRGYLSLAVAPGGVIYLFGTEIGDQMGCVALNEAWLKEGPPVEN